jgi:cysteine desulfuration protein SufE
MKPEQIAEEFSWLESWDDRYGYLIELGRSLPPMPETDKNDETRIEGCQSGVWIKMGVSPTEPPALTFTGDSDSSIVKGLVAIVISLVNGRSPQEILDCDIAGFFSQLNLESHLSPTRKTGLNELVKRVKQQTAVVLQNQ